MGTNKKLLVDVMVFDKDDLFEGTVDPAVIINGTDYLNDTPENCWAALENAGLTKGDEFIIPAGTAITNIEECGGATEYTFKVGDVSVTVDILLEDDEVA